MKLKIEKLVEGGQGIAHDGDSTYFIWNALPGEDVEAEILNKRKGVYEALVRDVLIPSPYRIKPCEEHHLSCSPWQIMSFEYENEVKLEIAKETYERIGKIEKEDIKILDIEIFSDGNTFGYRNKMEYSFIENEGKISFAFFKRGQKRKAPIDVCCLASPAINEVAKKVLDWANQNNLTERNLKSLIIRSNMKGEVIAGLFIKDEMGFDNYPTLDDSLLGFSLYYSTHKSPASVITKVLYQEGQDFLIEEILGKKFKYGINSFFQVNIPVFEMALKGISDSIRENSPNSKNLHSTDFYSGVGVIGISVGAQILVESNEEAVFFANENIELNSIVGVQHAVPVPAEKATEYIEKDKITIFDPPRAGLHEKVIDRILEAKPPKIIYLSCNIATQARDLSLLTDTYDIKSIKLYNFFPRTPHIEGLVVLESKQ